jgi:hypothetical protein
MAKFVLQCIAPAALLLAAAPQVSTAQARGAYGGWAYEWSLPMGDLKDFVSNDSWVGFTAQGRRFVSEGFAVGGFIGYTSFYTNTSDVIELPQGALSGDQYRHVGIMPIMVGFYKHLGSGGHPQPYLGLNLGAYYFYQMLDIGIFTTNTHEWLFGVAPELGVVLGVRGRTAMALQVRYHYPVSGGQFLSGSERSFQFVSVGFGMFGRSGY